MSKLILHVGAPKCGSSALQSVLHNLEMSGILRENMWKYPLKYSRGFGHGNADFITKSILNDDVDDLDEFLAECFNDKCNVILSDEMLYGIINKKSFDLIINKLKPIFKEIYIVVAIREPSSWLLSDYSQHIKQNKDVQDFSHHCAKREIHCNWSFQLKRYAELEGQVKNVAIDYLSILPYFSHFLGFDLEYFNQINKSIKSNNNFSLSDFEMESSRKNPISLSRDFTYKSEYKHLLRYLKLKHNGYEKSLPIEFIKL